MSGVRTSAVDLFTPDEHAVLAQWFDMEPCVSGRRIVPEEAARRLGFDRKPDHYSLADAVVAFVVLEGGERRLPQWATIEDDCVALGRQYRDYTKIPDRTVLLQPHHLFTINWADGGPGFSWPVAYYVTWLPYYHRFVVTASADSPDAFGYCDFALGAFGIDTPIKEGARKIICEDWTSQYNAGGQQRWVCLFGSGLVSNEEANGWAEEVWSNGGRQENCEMPVDAQDAEPLPHTWTEAEDERAAIIEYEGGVPRPWAEALARVDAACPPEDVPIGRWRLFIDDCAQFLDGGWAKKATALSWGPLDLFGTDREHPFANVDHLGLLWLLNGDLLVELHDDRAIVEAECGARRCYRRLSAEVDRLVLAWDITPKFEEESRRRDWGR